VLVQQLTVGPIQTNCYIIGDEASGVGAVIDPGGEADRILEEVETMGLQIAYVINTHAHFDHTLGNNEVIAATGAKLALHRADAPLLAQGGWASMFGLFGISSPKPDLLLEDGETVELGDVKLQVIHTPGHTPGGISLYEASSGVLFCGDSLFCGGIGRTDLPGGDYDTLMRSLQKLLALPDETVVYPGHGNSTTIENEKMNNPFIS
jgi:hydroxyacylglutathione hydrolase